MHTDCPQMSRNWLTQAQCCSQSCPAQPADPLKQALKVPAQLGALVLSKLTHVLIQLPMKSPHVHNHTSIPTYTFPVHHSVTCLVSLKKICAHHVQQLVQMQMQEWALGTQAGQVHQFYTCQLLVSCCCWLLLSAAVVASLGCISASSSLCWKSVPAAAVAVL